MPDPAPTPICVILADDHQMFIEALRQILDRDPSIEVVDVVGDGETLLEGIEIHAPDVALVDVTMPGPGARAIAGHAKQGDSSTRLIALTMHLDHGLAETLLSAGFAGFVVKDSAVAELLEAIHTVVAGGTYLSNAVRELGADRGQSPNPLTSREIDCLVLAAEGLSNKHIASELGITERTAKFHFENILRKLQASSRGEAVAFARRNAIL